MTNFNFLRPLTDEEYAALKADVAASGQHYPIIRDQNGVTLDGHHRERIAKELGIQEKVEVRTFADDAARIAFVIASNLHRRQSTAEDRKATAIRLYQEFGLTQQQIGAVLHVSQSTVRDYLSNLVETTKLRVEKRGRPKAKPKHKYPKEVELKAAELVLDEGVGVVKAANKLGVSQQVVIRSKEREEGRREEREKLKADPPITRKDLSLTAQQKFDAAIRQYQKKLDAEFEDRVRVEQLRREDIWLGWELEEFRKAVARNYNYPGFMSKVQYRDLQRCLHTDTIDGIAKQGVIDPATRKRFDDVLGLVIKLEAILVKDDKRTVARPSMEELMRRRAEVFAKRSAQSKAAAAKRNSGARP